MLVTVRRSAVRWGDFVGYTTDQLNDIFDRTSGYCHLCFARLAFANYGRFGTRGAWEVEHSNPRANGGTNRLHNLYAACISCNRSKGIHATRRVRGWYGYRAAPLSTPKRDDLRALHAVLGALVGYVIAHYVNASSSSVWIWVMACAWLAHRIEPDPQRR